VLVMLVFCLLFRRKECTLLVLLSLLLLSKLLSLLSFCNPQRSSLGLLNRGQLFSFLLLNDGLLAKLFLLDLFKSLLLNGSLLSLHFFLGLSLEHLLFLLLGELSLPILLQTFHLHLMLFGESSLFISSHFLIEFCLLNGLGLGTFSSQFRQLGFSLFLKTFFLS